MVTHTSLTSNKHKLYRNTMNQLCTIINYIQNISFHNKSKKNQNPHTSKKNQICFFGVKKNQIPYTLMRSWIGDLEAMRSWMRDRSTKRFSAMIAHCQPNVQFLKQDEQRHRTRQTRAVKSIPRLSQVRFKSTIVLKSASWP